MLPVKFVTKSVEQKSQVSKNVFKGEFNLAI